MDEIRDILLKMYENQKRHDEEMAEMKKTLNETKLEMSLLKENQRLSLRTTESCEEVLRTLVPGVQHLANRLQEVLDSSFGEDLSLKITEASNEIKRKVDEIQPALASFVIGQNGLRKQITTEFGKLEGLKKELTDTREELSNTIARSTETIQISTVQTKRQIEEIAEKIDQIKVDDILSAVRVVHSKVDNVQSSIVGIETTQNEVRIKIAESGQILEEMRLAVEEIGKRQEDGYFKNHILPRLTGYLEPMKPKVSFINGQIQITNGKKFSFCSFEKGIENNPWSIFPEDYGHILWAVEGITGVNGKITTYNGTNLTVSEFIIGVETKTFNHLNPKNYEVECSNGDCQKKVSISSCLREDKVSVKCSCSRLTPLGNPKPGFQWVYFSPCLHFQQVPSDKTPNNCAFCGKQGTCWKGFNHWASTPTSKS